MNVTFYQYRAENVLGNGASMIDKGKPVTSSDEQVMAMALDEYAGGDIPAPDLVKIDVEGAEVAVLDGGRPTDSMPLVGEEASDRLGNQPRH